MNEPNALIAQSLRRKGPNQTADPEGENRSQSPSAGLPSLVASEFSASTSSLRESDVPRQAGRQAGIHRNSWSSPSPSPSSRSLKHCDPFLNALRSAAKWRAPSSSSSVCQLTPKGQETSSRCTCCYANE